MFRVFCDVTDSLPPPSQTNSICCCVTSKSTGTKKGAHQSAQNGKNLPSPCSRAERGEDVDRPVQHRRADAENDGAAAEGEDCREAS